MRWNGSKAKNASNGSTVMRWNGSRAFVQKEWIHSKEKEWIQGIYPDGMDPQ
jgi:hypothetical protein